MLIFFKHEFLTFKLILKSNIEWFCDEKLILFRSEAKPNTNYIKRLNNLFCLSFVYVRKPLMMCIRDVFARMWCSAGGSWNTALGKRR